MGSSLVFGSKRLGFWLVAIWLSAPLPAGAEDWKPVRVWVSGGEQSIWLIGASGASGAGLPVVHMWSAESSKGGTKGISELTSAGSGSIPHASPFLPAVSGDPRAVSADSECLHILFSNLTPCDYFLARPYSPGTNWAEQCRAAPIAWAGDSAVGGLWAIVSSEDLRKPPSDSPAGKSEGGGEQGPGAAESRPSEPSIESHYALLSLRDGLWRRFEMPRRIDKARSLWLAVRGGRPGVFWQEAGAVFCIERVMGEWNKPRKLPLDEAFQHAWDGSSSTRSEEHTSELQ